MTPDMVRPTLRRPSSNWSPRRPARLKVASSCRRSLSGHGRSCPSPRASRQLGWRGCDRSQWTHSCEIRLRHTGDEGVSLSHRCLLSCVQVRMEDDTPSADLLDGRTITVPLAWFPRLLHATVAERANWKISGGGFGIHWPDLDEDLSSAGLLRGCPSPWQQRFRE